MVHGQHHHRSDVSRSARFVFATWRRRSPACRVCRRAARSPAGQRCEPFVRAWIAGACRAEGASRDDGGGEDRDSARHWRPRDSHGAHREIGDAARSCARARRISHGRTGARAASDRRGGRGATRVGCLALGRARGCDPPRGGTARHDVAADHQCRHHAGAVEDRVPG